METGADSASVALDAETQIFDGRGASVSPDRFSMVFEPGTPVDVVADMDSGDTGTALEVRMNADG